MANLVRIAGIKYESVTDGPGLRTTVFFQGCCHNCNGCHNPETWDKLGGVAMEIPELVTRLNLNPIVSGVSFSGGEPFLQAEQACLIAEAIKRQGKSLWVFTGFIWENLFAKPMSPGFLQLLQQTDVLVDGPFKLEQRDLTIPFRGSSNQRVIDVPRSLSNNDLVQLSF